MVFREFKFNYFNVVVIAIFFDNSLQLTSIRLTKYFMPTLGVFAQGDTLVEENGAYLFVTLQIGYPTIFFAHCTLSSSGASPEIYAIS